MEIVNSKSASTISISPESDPEAGDIRKSSRARKPNVKYTTGMESSDEEEMEEKAEPKGKKKPAKKCAATKKVTKPILAITDQDAIQQHMTEVAVSKPITLPVKQIVKKIEVKSWTPKSKKRKASAMKEIDWYPDENDHGEYKADNEYTPLSLAKRQKACTGAATKERKGKAKKVKVFDVKKEYKSIISKWNSKFICEYAFHILICTVGFFSLIGIFAFYWTAAVD